MCQDEPCSGSQLATGCALYCSCPVDAGPPRMNHDDIPADVWRAWSRACKCCSECSPTVCGGVQQGASCERHCHCADEDGDDLTERDGDGIDDYTP